MNLVQENQSILEHDNITEINPNIGSDNNLSQRNNLPIHSDDLQNNNGNDLLDDEELNNCSHNEENECRRSKYNRIQYSYTLQPNLP